MKNKSPENRQRPRIGLEVQVRVTSSDPYSKIFGWILDLSPGGLKLKAENPPSFKGVFHKGDEVFFETSDEFYNIRGRGRIMWTSDEEDIVGIKFDDLEDPSRKSIEDFLRICLQGDAETP